MDGESLVPTQKQRVRSTRGRADDFHLCCHFVCGVLGDSDRVQLYISSSSIVLVVIYVFAAGGEFYSVHVGSGT